MKKIRCADGCVKTKEQKIRRKIEKLNDKLKRLLNDKPEAKSDNNGEPIPAPYKHGGTYETRSGERVRYVGIDWSYVTDEHVFCYRDPDDGYLFINSNGTGNLPGRDIIKQIK